MAEVGAARAMLDALPDPVVRADVTASQAGTDIVVREANPAALAQAVDDPVGRSLAESFPEQADLLPRLLQVVATGRSLALDGLLRTDARTGATRPVSLRAVPMPTGGESATTGLCITWRDETPVVSTGHGFTDAEERHLLLAGGAFDVTFRLTPDGCLEWASPGLGSLTGRSTTDLVGLHLSELVDPADADAAAQVVREIRDGGDPDPLRLRIRGASGELTWISIHARGIRRAHEELTVIVGGWRDITAQMRAAHARADSERRYRLLAEHAAEVVLQTGPSGSITWASPSVGRVLGWRPEELVGRHAAGLVHPDDLPGVRAVRREVLARGDLSGEVEARFATADGGWRWMSDLGSAITDEDGAVVGGVDALRDIHEARLARESLARSEERLRAAIDTMLDPWVLLEAVRDDSGRIVDFTYADANEAVCRLDRIAREDLIGSSVVQRFPELVERGTLAEYVRVVETGQPLVLDEYPFTDPVTGRTHWYDNRGVRVGDGLTLTWRDVTDRRTGAEALRQSEEHYRLLADHASDIVFRGTADSRVDWISPSVTEALGWSPADLVGRATVDLVDPVDRERVAALFAESGTAETLAYRARFLTADGDSRWMAVTVRSVRSPDSELLAWVGSARDADAEQRAQEALAESEHRFRLLAENASDIVYQTDSAGEVVWISPSVTGWLGWRAEELVGRSLAHYVVEEDQPVVAATRERIRQGDPVTGAVVRIMAADGTPRWVSVAGRRLTDASGAVTGLVVGVRDIDEVVRARERAQALADRLRATADGLLDPQILLESVRDDTGAVVDFTYLEVNRATGTYLSLPAASLIGSRLSASFPGVRESGLLALLADAVATGAPLRLVDWPYRNEVLGAPRRYDLGANRVGDGLSVSWRDVTERYAAAEALAESERRFRLLANNVSDVVFHARDGIVLWVSPSVTKVFGVTPDEWIGTPLTAGLHHDDLASFADGVARVDDGATVVQRLRVWDRWRAYHWVEAHATRYVDEEGRPDGMIASLRVVDEQVAAERELDRLARSDALTGLVNRAEGLRRLEQRLSAQRRSGDRLALAYCDLDAFKTVNDTLGHGAGDQLLMATAQRIRGCLRDGDVVARLGGDEILLVLDAVHGPQDAVAIAEKVRAAVARPVPGSIPDLRSTVSIGVVLAEPGEAVDALVARADRAMYRAKQEGRNRVVLG